jgi:hypothetical protein
MTSFSNDEGMTALERDNQVNAYLSHTLIRISKQWLIRCNSAVNRTVKSTGDEL